MKFKCVLVDDDSQYNETIHSYLADSPVAELVEIFTCPIKFLKAEPKLKFDVCLLDICLPEISGFEVAEILNKKNRPVIFISGKKEKLLDAFSMVSSLDIIPKPVDKHRLNWALEKASKLLQPKQLKQQQYGFFHVVGKVAKVKIRYSDILYIRTDNHDRRHKHVYLKGEIKYILTHCIFEEILEVAPELIRVNKSEIISFDACSEIEQDVITLKDVIENGRPKQVTLNRWFKKDFFERNSPNNYALL